MAKARIDVLDRVVAKSGGEVSILRRALQRSCKSTQGKLVIRILCSAHVLGVRPFVLHVLLFCDVALCSVRFNGARVVFCKGERGMHVFCKCDSCGGCLL